MRLEDKTCAYCSDFVSDCEHCSQSENGVECHECDYDMRPILEGTKCTECGEDEYENEYGDCVRCSEELAFCGECEVDNFGAWHCTACLGELEETLDDMNEIVSCDCDEFEFVSYLDNHDRDTAQCLLCETSIPHCNSCVDAHSTLLQSNPPDWWKENLGDVTQIQVACTDCQDPFFIGESGQSCTDEPCRSWDKKGKCTACNTRVGETWMP